MADEPIQPTDFEKVRNDIRVEKFKKVFNLAAGTIAIFVVGYFLMSKPKPAKVATAYGPAQTAATSTTSAGISNDPAVIAPLPSDHRVTRTDPGSAGVQETVSTRQTSGGSGGVSSEQQIEQQMEKERYDFEKSAAFASNVVSFRSEGNPPQGPTPQPAPAPTPAQPSLLTQMENPRTDNPDTCLLDETTVMEGVLDSKIEGEMAGPIDAHISNDVYCPNTKHVVIPKGTKLSGETSTVSALGQRRLAVIFHKMFVEPPLGKGEKSFPISLDPVEPGLDQQGAAGLTGKVDNHTWSLLAAAAVVGLLEGANISIYSNNGGYSPASGLLSGATSGISQSTARILDRYTNRLPTIEVPEGQLIRLRLKKDLLVPKEYPWQKQTVNF